MSSRLDGTICALQDLQREGPTLHCLTRGDSIGLTAVIATGVISASAVLLVYLMIIINVTREYLKPLSRRRRLIRRPIDIYLLSLFTADLLSAIGSMMNIRWMDDGKVEVGAYCNVQGIINQAGPVAVSLNSLVIVIVTFISVWWRKSYGSASYHILVASAITGMVWILVILLVFVPAGIHNNPSDLYFAPTPVWCTISKNYDLLRLLVKYIWFWLSFVVTLVLYILLAFLSQGYITVHCDIWWKFRVHGKRGIIDERQFFWATIAYPFSNTVLLAPLSIVRWLQNAGSNQDRISTVDSLAVGAVFGLSGVVNVILFLFIRPNFLLFGKETDIDRRSTPKSSQPQHSVELEPVRAEANVEQGQPPLADDHSHLKGR